MKPNISIIACILIFLLYGSNYGWEKNGDAPGNWEIHPNLLFAGETTTIELRYTQGDAPLPPGSYHRILLEPLSVQILVNAPPSNKFKVVPYLTQLPETKLKIGMDTGINREITVFFPKGLVSHQSFAIQIGNLKENGEIESLVNPVPVHHLSFPIYSDLEGKGNELDWFEMGWWKQFPSVTIEGAGPEALRIFAPSLVKTGDQFSVRVAVCDRFDDRAYPIYRGKVQLDEIQNVQGLPKTIQYANPDFCSKLLNGIIIRKPGIYRVRARLEKNSKLFESNPIIVRDSVKQPIYWGSLHNHDMYSECWGDGPQHFYRFGKEISGMDYLASSEHAAEIPGKIGYGGRLYAYRFGKKITTLATWIDRVTTANAFYSPGHFVTIFGYEWSSEESGHYDIFFLDDILDHLKQFFTPEYVDYSYEMRDLLEKTDALFIPHKHASYFNYAMLEISSTQSGEPLSPVIEVYSDWGMSFDPYGIRDSLLGGLDSPMASSYLEAIGRGYKLGVIADSDSHTGLPGRRFPANVSTPHNRPQGITAVRADEITRQGIFSAYRKRNTYGTSGERIFLDFTANDSVGMGETLRTDQPFQLKLEVAGTDTIEHVNLFEGDKKIADKTLDNPRQGELIFPMPAPQKLDTPYTVEIIQKNHHRAWSSPIWVSPYSVPDLAWQLNPNGRLQLVNQGTAPAKDVQIMYSKTEYPFVNPPIRPKTLSSNDTGAQIWTTPWNNYKTILHYRWQGPPIKGTILLKGVKDYLVDPSLRMKWFEKVIDHKDGTIDFTGYDSPISRSARPGLPKPEGLDITLIASGDKPCTATFSFEREIKLWVGQDENKSQNMDIPLNGLISENNEIFKTLPSLKPGETWLAPNLKGYWSVDPFHRITKINESNNLFKRL